MVVWTPFWLSDLMYGLLYHISQKRLYHRERLILPIYPLLLGNQCRRTMINGQLSCLFCP
jgi:hypothetical protein